MVTARFIVQFRGLIQSVHGTSPGESLFGRSLPINVYSDTLLSGGMAEWFKAAVLKTVGRETVPGVRIPLPPFLAVTN